MGEMVKELKSNVKYLGLIFNSKMFVYEKIEVVATKPRQKFRP